MAKIVYDWLLHYKPLGDQMGTMAALDASLIEKVPMLSHDARQMVLFAFQCQCSSIEGLELRDVVMGALIKGHGMPMLDSVVKWGGMHEAGSQYMIRVCRAVVRDYTEEGVPLSEAADALTRETAILLFFKSCADYAKQLADSVPSGLVSSETVDADVLKDVSTFVETKNAGVRLLDSELPSMKLLRKLREMSISGRFAFVSLTECLTVDMVAERQAAKSLRPAKVTGVLLDAVTGMKLQVADDSVGDVSEANFMALLKALGLGLAIYGFVARPVWDGYLARINEMWCSHVPHRGLLMRAEAVVRAAWFREGGSLEKAVKAAAAGTGWDAAFLSKVPAATLQLMMAEHASAKRAADDAARSTTAALLAMRAGAGSPTKRPRLATAAPAFQPAATAVGAGKGAAGGAGKAGKGKGAKNPPVVSPAGAGDLTDLSLIPFKGGTGCVQYHVKGSCEHGDACKNSHVCPLRACQGAVHSFKVTHPTLAWSGKPKTA